MRSFTAILLLAFSLPLYVLAAHEHPRRHTGLARRAPGHVLEKRYSNARLTYYDITVGMYARFPATNFPFQLFLPSTAPLVAINIRKLPS